MMYQWTADMVRFMEDASRNSQYFSSLADILEPYLVGFKSVCDAGCGLGQLSCELGRRGYDVMASDVSETAIDYLKKRNPANVNPVCCDLLSFIPEKKFDAMIFNYFGSTRQILEIARRCCRDTVLIIKKDYKLHRFSFSENPITSGSESAEDFLRENNVPFSSKKFALEFGQPFTSLDDALLFFQIYSRDKDRSLINRENVVKRLICKSDGEYYLPHIKQSTMMVIKMEDL